MQNKLIICGEKGYKYYTEISFLKGFSIFTIVIMHLIQGYITELPNVVKLIASLGGTGLHVFFFCSGFGLYISYLKRGSSYVEFLRKHFLKVYFPYIFMVFICFCVPMIKFDGNRVIALLSHIFLFKMFSPTYVSSFGPFWFMSTLFQFYFLFVPLCILKERLGTKVFLISCFSLSMLWWIFTGISGLNDIRPIGCFCLQYLWEFSLGMCVAEHLSSGKNIQINTITLFLLMVAGIGLEGVLALSGSIGKAFNDFAGLIGYGSMGLLLYQNTYIKRIGIWVGNISYEWFLVHDCVYAIFFGVLSPGHIVSQIMCGITCLCVSLCVAYLYNGVIKRINANRIA